MPSVPWPSRQSALKFACAILIWSATVVFYIDLCGIYFQCGCRSLWAGGIAQCNIYRMGVKHCPICTLQMSENGAVVIAILIAQAIMMWRGKWLWAIILFPLLVGIQALALGWYRGYWS